MSKLLFLEHINVNSGTVWTTALEGFYFLGLGFARDPRAEGIFQRNLAYGTDSTGLEWANIGLQQFHLPWTDAQVLRGTVGLYLPSLQIVAPRLRRQNIPFEVKQLAEETVFELVDPIGNQFRLHEYVPVPPTPGVDRLHLSPYTLFGPGELTLPLSLSDNNVVDSTDQYICSLQGERSLGIGIGYIDFDVPIGTAARIAAFYAYYFDAEVEISAAGYRNNALDVATTGAVEDAVGSQLQQSRVRLGRQCLYFTEREQVAPYDGHHICIYISALADVYTRMENSSYPNQLFINPRFLRTASHNLEEALMQKEFRFKDIVDLDTNEVLYELEHEVRSLEHPSCCVREKN